MQSRNLIAKSNKTNALTEDIVQEWHGSFDDVLAQMHIDLPF